VFRQHQRDEALGEVSSLLGLAKQGEKQQQGRGHDTGGGAAVALLLRRSVPLPPPVSLPLRGEGTGGRIRRRPDTGGVEGRGSLHTGGGSCGDEDTGEVAGDGAHIGRGGGALEFAWDALKYGWGLSQWCAVLLHIYIFIYIYFISHIIQRTPSG